MKAVKQDILTISCLFFIIWPVHFVFERHWAGSNSFNGWTITNRPNAHIDYRQVWRVIATATCTKCHWCIKERGGASAKIPQVISDFPWRRQQRH